jgi:hypothetical protein
VNLKNSNKEISPFTSADICAIIKECGHSGVRQFKFRGLEISYGKIAEVASQDFVHVPQDIQTQTDSQAREAIAKREQTIKQDLIDNMLVEDPLGYEQLLKDEELVDERSEDTEE